MRCVSRGNRFFEMRQQRKTAFLGCANRENPLFKDETAEKNRLPERKTVIFRLN